MPKKRPRHDAGHPTVKDPTPYDCCGWCYDWITSGHVVVRLSGLPQPAGEVIAELVIDEHTVLTIVPQPGSKMARAGVDLVAILCSEACAAALEAGLDADRRRAAGEIVPRPEPSAEKRKEAEGLVAGVCACCGRRAVRASSKGRSRPRRSFTPAS